jgi:hypothetical protein
VPDSLTSSPVRPLLDRLFQAAHGYLSVSFPESDGLEITCRL